MSSADDDDHFQSVNSDILLPVTADKTPIKFDNNDASILGILHEVKLYYVRAGLFSLLFEHGAAPVGSKIAVDSVDAAYFTDACGRPQR